MLDECPPPQPDMQKLFTEASRTKVTMIKLSSMADAAFGSFDHFFIFHLTGRDCIVETDQCDDEM